MTFLDELRQHRSASTSVYLQFRLQYKAGTRDLHLFFEGVDDLEYFLPELRRRWQSNGRLIWYLCDGKGGVLRARTLVVAAIDNTHRCLFFVDRDFDDFVGIPQPTDDNVYVTDGYSIESDVVTEAAIEIVLDDLVHLAHGDARRDKIVEMFRQGYATFAAAILPYMAWSIAARRDGQKPNLKNVRLEKCIMLDPGLLARKKKGGLQTFSNDCGCEALQIAFPRMRSIVQELKKVPPSRSVRGKYAIWYLVNFINTVWQTLVGKDNGSGRKIVKKVDVNAKNVVQLLAGRLPYPLSVVSFLDQNLAKV